MILIRNYTCSRNINEKSHLCFSLALRIRSIINISLNTRAIYHKIFLKPCDFLYKLYLYNFFMSGQDDFPERAR